MLRRKGGSSNSWDILLFLSGIGSVWVNAPGADGAKNRFGAGTEPMIWGEFHLYQSANRLYLKGVEVREHFWSIRKSRGSLTAAVKWLGAVAATLPLGLESDSLLSLLWWSMKNLSVGVSPILLDVRFAARWCGIWGRAPSLSECALCGKSPDPGAHPCHMTSAGLVCGSCRANLNAVRDIAFYKEISSVTAYELKCSAMLSKDNFFAWAKGRKPSEPNEMRECAAWLYTLLKG